jgi:glycosyltransferase involved in cell wall biosynthesis
MRIGIISGEFPPMQGGVGDYSLELSRALIERGHEVYVLTSRAATPIVHEPGLHVQATVSRWGRWGKSQRQGGALGTQQALGWAQHHQLEMVNVQYEAAAYDMQVAVNYLPRTLIKEGIPVVTTFHDLLVPYLFPKAGTLRKRVVHQMARDSLGVIITNLADERELQQLDEMPPLKRIPIGSNIALNVPSGYDRAEWRAKMRIPPSGFLVGYFGFVNHSKGVDTLAHAIRLLVERDRNIHLLMIGGTTGASDETNIKQADVAMELIGGLGISRRVHWTGFVSQEEVSAYLQACDVMAFPFRDGVSLRRGTLMAALAHGCPIITTFPEEELPELTSEQPVMRLIHPDSPQELAAALEELMKDEQERMRLGAAAARLSSRFRWDSIASQMVQFFEQLISERLPEIS